MRDPGHNYYPKGKVQQDHPDSVCRTVAVRTAAHKLVYRTEGLNELYDMVKDPRELKNVYGRFRYRKVQKELEARLLRWMTRTSDVVPFDTDPRGITPVGQPPQSP